MIYRNGFLLKIYTSSYDLIRLLPVMVNPFLLRLAILHTYLDFSLAQAILPGYSLAKSMNSVGEKSLRNFNLYGSNQLHV